MSFRLKKILAFLLGALFVFPFVYMLLLSLSQSWSYPDLIPSSLTFRNWLAVFEIQGELFESFSISVLISLSVAIMATATGFITSKFIAYHPNRKVWMLLSYFPFILSPVIYAACIYYLFIRSGLSGNIGGVILGQLIIAYPYAIILFSGFWNKKLQGMQELVSTLGGTPMQAYIRILIPAAKGMILVCFFQTFLISWFEYGLTTIIGVGKVQTLTLNVFQYISEANIYYAALSSCLLILPPAFLLYVNKKFVFREKTI